MHPFPRSTPRPSTHARRLARQMAALGLGLIASSFAHAADFYKANNESALNTITAWENLDGTPVAAAPDNNANTNTWYWNSRVTAAAHADGVQNVLLGADRWTGTLHFSDMGVPVIITGATNQSLTINTGIDMSNAAHDVTFQTFNTSSNLGIRLHAGSSSYTFSVAAGRTLTFNAAKIAVRSGGSNSLVTFPGPGKVVFNDQFQVSHAVINGGRVEFNSPSGTTRIATSVDPAVGHPISYTNINGGVVMVNNTSGSATGDSIVSVNATGTLGGSGRITGSLNSVVNANAGSTLAPGNDGIGTLSIGKLNLVAGSRIVWEGTNPVESDLLAVTGADGLKIEGSIATDDADANHPVISLYNPGTTEPFTGTGVFNLFSYVGTITGAGLNALRLDPATLLPNQTYTLGLSANAQGVGLVTLEISDNSITPRDWAVDASGLWSNSANWTGGIVPDAIKDFARITGPTGASLTAPRTVTLDSPRTVGKLYLDSAQTVTLAGSSPLTLDQGAGAAILFADGGNHIVQTPLALTDGGLTTTVDDSGQTLTLAGPISGLDVGLVKIGAGTLVLTADNTYTGATAAAAGTLQIGNGGTTGSVGGLISTSSKLRFNRSDSITLSTPISGTGDVEFAGVGATTLSVANTFSGDTKISAGSLILAHGQALQNSTLIHSNTGGPLIVADPVATLVLGGLSGDRAIPLTNTLSAPLALTVGGNNDTTTYAGSPAGTGLSFTKTGSGSLTLTGVHAYDDSTATTPVGTLVSAGSLVLGPDAVFSTPKLQIGTGANAKLTVGGGTLNASAEALVKNATLGLEITSGVANFTGGLRTDLNSSSGTNIIRVLGGTLNAASISTGRSGATLGSDAATGRDTDGLFINGGTVNVSGALNLGEHSSVNSSLSARMDSGTLTVNGLSTLGINSPDRWAVLDINGGVFNANGGIQLGSPSSGNVVMHLRKASAIVNTPGIRFGQGAVGGKATLSLSAGTLYVGADGINLGTTNPAFVPVVKLLGGTLGATADWSSTLPLSISDQLFTVTGADAANNPHTVLLQGKVTGLGSLAKTGAGTVLFDNPTNDYFGPTLISAGTLGLAGKTSDTVTIDAGATLRTTAPLQVAFSPVHVNGTLAVGYNAAAGNPVNTLTTDLDAVNIGANAALHISGTGILPGPFHVLVQAPLAGINGSFAPGNVTGIPAGFVLDQAYDHDANAATPAVIALVGAGVASPYDTWAASYSLAGADAETTADPDSDGMNNLLEYALDTDPTLGDNASAYTVARSGNNLTLTFDHAGDSSLTYVVEATNDLAASPWPESTTLPAFTAEGSYTHTDTADLSTNPRRFLRLKITKAP